MNVFKTTALVLAATLAAASATAEPISVEAVMTPTDSIKMEFADGSKHFVLMVRREGVAKGSGPFDGAKVVEHGWHDINPPIGGDPQGYLELTAANGDIAYLKWTVRAVFLKGAEKPKLFDNGFWELVSGTGQFAGMAGVGSLIIKPASKTERLFILEGEIGPRP
ncbi:MAG: hypothetical protein OEN23_06390 [Paracoccaceae bacterium]|nr:hypothetical protein [Paracoccaceae bacterium]